ncbi:hypothetical protein XarbCFBP8150_04075 [Xanthomonas arboricola]|nr:hypothetical protein XarbCFBP8150_04075 [Xanthomonas arboricola]
MHRALLAPCPPAISDGPCPPTLAGPYAASMPRKVPRGWVGLQPGRRSTALRLCHSPVSEHWPKGPTLLSAALRATHAWHPSASRRPRPRP